MLSDQGIEMLEKTCDVPSELMNRLVKERHTDKTCKEVHAHCLCIYNNLSHMCQMPGNIEVFW